MFQPSTTTDRPLTEQDQCQNDQEQSQHGGVDVELAKPGSVTPESTKVVKLNKKRHINSTPGIDELKREVEETVRKKREKLSRKAQKKILVKEEKDDVSDDEADAHVYIAK